MQKHIIARATKRLFVGNLPKSAKDFQLENLFKQFGPVSFARVSLFPGTKFSRGFAFVEFEKLEDAEKALSQKVLLSGNELTLRPAEQNYPENAAKPVIVNDHGFTGFLGMISPISMPKEFVKPTKTKNTIEENIKTVKTEEGEDGELGELGLMGEDELRIHEENLDEVDVQEPIK
eukprot:c17690_g2_i1.p1 GENE.c17690_g2_i1~~c17690_g2_i1.p1  ORF type:complete len:176 (-),score=68.16 c17690_g2_i1:20-547(-)